MKHTWKNCIHRDYCDSEACVMMGGPEMCNEWEAKAKGKGDES